jgi:hypothetical protein
MKTGIPVPLEYIKEIVSLPSENSLDKDKVRKTGSRTRLSGQTNKG